MHSQSSLRTDFFLGALLISVLGAIIFGNVAPAQAQQVDRTTPHLQDGLTLLAICRGDAQGQYHFPVPPSLDFLTGPSGSGPAGGIGLWVRGPRPTPTTQNERPGFPGNAMALLTASALAANGETIPVQYQQQSVFSQGLQSAPSPIYLLSIPAGYPAHFGPITVTLTTSDGHHAHWRLTNLPPSYHAISGAAPLHSTYSRNGIHLKATAWRDNGVSYFGNRTVSTGTTGVDYQITGSVPPNTHWLVRVTKEQLEWEPLPPTSNSVPQYGRFPARNITPPLFVTSLGSQRPGTQFPFAFYPNQGRILTPYASSDHSLRLIGQIVKIADAQETVTFHDLNIHALPNPYTQFHPLPRGAHIAAPAYSPPPSYAVSARPQTIVTPSGVSVTLLPFSSLPQNQGYYRNNGSLQMLVRFNSVSPSMIPISLPRSPLARKYHKPVILTISATAPLLLQQSFPIGGFGPPLSSVHSGAEFIITLQPVGRPNPVMKMLNGRQIMVYKEPAMPKYLPALTLTLSQRAELHAIPVSFLLPIQSKSPLTVAPMPGFHRLPRFHPIR